VERFRQPNLHGLFFRPRVQEMVAVFLGNAINHSRFILIAPNFPVVGERLKRILFEVLKRYYLFRTRDIVARMSQSRHAQQQDKKHHSHILHIPPLASILASVFLRKAHCVKESGMARNPSLFSTATVQLNAESVYGIKTRDLRGRPIRHENFRQGNGGSNDAMGNINLSRNWQGHEGWGLAVFLLCFYLYCDLYRGFSSPAVAQVGTGLPHFRHPPQVRMVGTLVPLEEKNPGKLKTLIVHVKGKSWKFRLEEITVLTAVTRSGWSLLNDLFPPKLHFIGAEHLLVPLQQDTIEGKQLELEGRLYVGDHQLFLSSVIVKESETPIP
jgi:hypothetical protein